MRVLAVGSGTSLGYFGRTGTKYRRGPGTDFHLCTTPYTTPAGCEPSFGTFTLDGASPSAASVTFSDLKANEYPKLTLVTKAGTGTGLAPATTLTAGTGFAAGGANGDTSTWAWEMAG